MLMMDHNGDRGLTRYYLLLLVLLGTVRLPYYAYCVWDYCSHTVALFFILLFDVFDAYRIDRLSALKHLHEAIAFGDSRHSA